MLGGSGEDGNRFLFCRSILLMAERLQREQERPKEDRHIKSGDRRLDKNLNADKFKAKEMFKLCNSV